MVPANDLSVFFSRQYFINTLRFDFGFWNVVYLFRSIFSYIWQPNFFQKNPHQARMTKNDKKWSKNRVFEIFKKIKLLLLSGISVKRKFLWSFNILQKSHAWEKSGSQLKLWPIMALDQWDFIINISLIHWYLTLIFGI